MDGGLSLVSDFLTNFLTPSLASFTYDWLVERRQKILLAKASRTHQIVASLFPKQVRDQILQDDVNERKPRKDAGDSDQVDGKAEAQNVNDTTIADLYPEATILFAGTLAPHLFLKSWLQG